MPGKISARTTVAELMINWPAVFPLFIKKRLACIGCDMARFDTLEDIARNYQLELDDFLNEIRAVVKQVPKNQRGKDDSDG